MPKTFLEPGSDYVLVVDVVQTQSIDGIELPDNIRQKEMLTGFVVSTGPQCTRAFEKDTVMYGPYAGKHVVFGGTEFRILKEGQIELWVRTSPDPKANLVVAPPITDLDVYESAMDKETIEDLKTIAARRTWADGLNADTIVDDYAGGNIDDAYEGGFDSGQTGLAREILRRLGVPFTVKPE